jgi:hypothetical protein
MIQLIYDGISIENDKIVYNDNKDNENDIINLISPDIYESEFGGNIYYFGYTFNVNASRKDRTTILKWIKNLDGNGIDETTLRKFIDKPLKYFNREVNLSDFDCLLYPRSNRIKLTKISISEFGRFTQHDLERISFEFVKAAPIDVYFDWKMFDSDYSGDIGDNQYNQIKDYIENTLIPKIHNLSYFSIADSVKPKYRQYIKNYLTLDEQSMNFIKAVKNGKILIVDDINTSGSTLTEILRVVNKLNNQCEIYIFTLIEKR